MMAPIMPFHAGIVELLMVLILGSGMGVPLGVPPQDPDPLMAKIAPEKCLYYTTWSGMAKADPKSANQTEQLLSEPEIQAFMQEVERTVKAVIQERAGQVPSREAGVIIQRMPLLVKTLITHPAALFLESVTPGAGTVEVKGALVVRLGPELNEVRRALLEISEIVQPEFVSRVTVEEVQCIRVRLPGDHAPAVTFGFWQDYLIATTGDGSFEGVLGRAATAAPQWLTEANDSLKVPRPSSFAYADVASILKTASGLGMPDVQRWMDALGLTAVTSAISVSGLDEAGFVSRTKIFTNDAEKGLGGLVTAMPLTPPDLAGIPRDASIAVALRLDLEQVWKKGLEIVEEVDPRAAEAVARGAGQLEQPLGLSIQDDLLASLGDVWTLHAAPGGGGLLAGWTLSVNLKDPAKARQAHQKVLQFAQAVLQQNAGFDPNFAGPQIRKFTSHGETAYSLDVRDSDFFLAPSWCLTKTHLVVTLLPQTLKSHLAADPTRPSLADQEAVASLLAQEPGVSAISYQDTRGHFETFYPFVQYAAQVAAKELGRNGIDIDATALPSIAAVAPHLLPTVSAARKSPDGFESMTHTTLPGASVGASAPVMAALLLPAVQAAREASRRTQSINNLKQIGLAMHNFHDVYGGLPAAYNVDKNGKPLLSWRVHVLPFLEQQAVYEQFHFDEPWDSPHNRTLIASMPAVYRSPSSAADPGKTVYLGIAGEAGVFVAPPERQKDRPHPTGTRFQDVPDGTSNTIMTVEVSDPSAVIWTKPDDFDSDQDNPLRSLVGIRPGGFIAGFCDGSVRFISAGIDAETLKALLTKNGGEMVGGDF